MARMSTPPKYATLFYPFLRSHGLPLPVAEHRFDPARRWRFDMAWIEAKVAIEIEGGLFVGGRHNRGAGMRADMEKYNAGTVAGWKILRVMPEHLCTAATIALLRQAISPAREGGA